MAYNVNDIAHKIISHISIYMDGEEYSSNMKLQKLLYYQQGFHLAFFGTPLFDEDLEAWQYGPVVPCVYSRYSIFGRSGILPDGAESIILTNDEEDLFDQVLKIYGDYSAGGLMNMSHNESPWKTTPVGMGNVIEKSKLIKFFKTRIQQ